MSAQNRTGKMYPELPGSACLSRNETGLNLTLRWGQKLSVGSNRETAEMRYLLGDLSQDDEIRIEEAFFADDARFEELEIAEAELIDAYVQKRLSAEDQRQFEAKLRTSPPLLERVKFARLLKDKAAESFSSPQEVSSERLYTASQSRPAARLKWWEGLLVQPAFRVANAAGVFVILVGGGVLFVASRNLHNHAIQLASERAAWEQQRQSSDQQAKIEQLSADLQRERELRAEDLKFIEEYQQANRVKEAPTQQPSLSTFATVFLTPGSLRSGAGAQSELTIRPEATTARLQLALERSDYPTYNAAIQTAEGTEVARKSRLRPHKTQSGHQLLLSVPTTLLTRGDYTVHLDGVTASGQVETVSDYAFRVVKRP